MHVKCGVAMVLVSTALMSPPDYETLYTDGITYVEFRNAAESREQAWKQHYANAEVADALLMRMRALPGTWRLLAVAEDWCGDSANTIPYIAKLVDLADNLDMRIIDSEVGKPIMEAHRTPAGLAATPTVILLNDRFEEMGCFVERPTKLQDWFQGAKEKLEEDELYAQKYAWYAEDAGNETLKEIVAMVEAAVSGEGICGEK